MTSPAEKSEEASLSDSTPPPTSPPSGSRLQHGAPSTHLGAALNYLVPKWLSIPFSRQASHGSTSGKDEQVATSHDEELLDDVQATCQMCAACRAAESLLPPAQRLFEDPLARHFSLPSKNKSMGLPKPRIAIRTRYFDDFVCSAVAGDASSDSASAKPIDQLVILGAGMDSRAYRLGRKGGERRKSEVSERLADAMSAVDVYEVDSTQVLSLKKALLEAAASNGLDTSQAVKSISQVTGDVSKTGWEASLVEAGFDWRKPSVWVLEGLVYYLTEDRVRALLRILRKLAAPGSNFCVSMVRHIREGRKGGGAPSGGENKCDEEVKRVVPKFTFACPDPRSFLERLDFQVDEIDELGGPNANFGRWPRGELPSSNTVYVKFSTSCGRDLNTVKDP